MNNYPGLYATETNGFGIEDLSYSRTDNKGVILSGNETFRRVSGYEWSELVNAPHNLLRHPDMPRGVFHLLWSHIEAGKPVGGYVMNRTKDEAPYWVFVVMVPIEQGYVSVCLKPASGLLDKIRGLYDTLRKAEDDENVSPEASSTALQEALADEGYENYAHFMSYALCEETIARCEALNQVVPARIPALRNITKHVETIGKFGSTVEMLFSRTEQIPYNMRLQAGRLEGADGPISVISDNHRQMAQMLSHSLVGFRDAAEVGAEPLREALFLTAVSGLVPDLQRFHSREVSEDTEAHRRDLVALNQLEQSFHMQARAAILDVADKVRQFARICRDMRRMMSGLEMTRIMCKIERSKAQGDTEGLDEIVNRLQSSEQDLDKVMTQIEDAVRSILESADQLTRNDPRQAA